LFIFECGLLFIFGKISDFLVNMYRSKATEVFYKGFCWNHILESFLKCIIFLKALRPLRFPRKSLIEKVFSKDWIF